MNIGGGSAFGALATLALLAALSVALVDPARSAGQSAKMPTGRLSTAARRAAVQPATQIDTSNVKGLKVAWRFRVPKTLGSENYPVIVGRTAYVTTSYGNIYALDA